MLHMITSYFANVRVINKNITAASRFSPDDRALVAEHLYTNQRLIGIIERGGLEHYPPLDAAAIHEFLVESFHNCTRMGAQATAQGGRTRRDPFLNLASTLQGLYAETIVARHKRSHKRLLDRINSTVGQFVDINLPHTKRGKLELDLRQKVDQLIQPHLDKR
jgi:hypothetical protein